MNPEPIVRLLNLDGLESFSHEAMATQFQFHLASPTDGSALRPIAEEAFRLLDRIEERLSFYVEGSDVTRINRASEGEILRVDEITHHCLLTALEVSAASEGAFDPFAGHAAVTAKQQDVPPHLADLIPPAPNDNAAVLALDPHQALITKLAGRRWLDLGAIGKGAALDAMADLLREWDVPAAVLSAGGSSILVYGTPCQRDHATWDIRLLQSPGQPIVSLPAPFALGASGEGFQPGHIIGNDARHAVDQALIVAPTAALADALSTAAILLPGERMKSLLGDDPRFGALATQQQSAVISSGAFTDNLKLPQARLSLVIPCRCESKRLPPFLEPLAASINDHHLPVEIIVVDDDSPAAELATTQVTVEAIRQRFPQIRAVQSVGNHRGKGGAVYHGWRQATAETEWLGFVDADGAVPVDAVVHGIKKALSTPSPHPLLAANRYHHNRDLSVRRSWLRQRTGGWFAQWAAKRLQLPVQDSQCGFKIVPAGWWRSRSTPWQEMGYAFDLELLLAADADNVRILNLDIAWQEVGGSHVGLTDGLNLVRTVKRLQRLQVD